MADTTALKNRIRAAIKANDNQEITGPVLQQALLDMVDELNGATETEAGARQSGDSTLQQGINTERQARIDADAALSNRLGSTITAENTAAGQIGAEAEAREAADTALQGLIDGITENIENGYVYAGIATPSSTPTTGKVFYLALTAGTYTNFGNITVTQGINILKYNGSAWSLDAFIGIDDTPTAESNNLVKSSGLADYDKMKSEAMLSSMSVNTNVIDTFVAANEQIATLKQNIILSKDGDSIEFTLKSCSYDSSDNKHNAFARNPNNPSKIAIAIAVNYVGVRTDDSTRIFDYPTETVGKTFKISFENGNIVLYKNEVAVLTYSGQKTLTIDSFGNGSQGAANYGYWGGSIKNLKINGILVSLKDLCQTFTATESITSHKLSEEDFNNIESISEIAGNVELLNSEVDSLLPAQKYIFDSAQESYFVLSNPIVLSQNGDSLEFKINTVPQYYGASSTQAYTLGYNPNNAQKIALGISQAICAVRADDGTWFCDIVGAMYNDDVIKISYEDGNVVIYKNGVVIATHTGQKTLTISSFGNGSQGSGNYGYWDGIISNIKVNGEKYTLIGTNHNVDVVSDEESSVVLPKMMIEKAANLITLYLLYKGNQYIGYPINYRYKAYTADEYPSFYDNWGVGRIFIADYNAEYNSMSVNQYLFLGGEAELAVETPNVKYGETGQSQYKFSGGVAHGFENIVTEDETRKFMLLINNISYAESSVIPLTAIESFDMFTLTQIYQAYTNENPYGLVNKHWFVKDGLFQIRTTMKMLRSVYLNQSEFGMFCIYRHAEGDASKPYLTNRAIENDDIFKAYDVSDGWESDSANNKLRVSNYATSEIILYGQKDMGFSMKIVDANTIAPASGSQNGGGMSMATNGGNAYNKVYFDLTGHHTPNVDDELYATQVWSIK